MVVLTCHDGAPMARAVAAVPGVEVVAVVSAPLPRPRTLRKRLEAVVRYNGWTGLARSAGAKVAARLRPAAPAGAEAPCPELRFDSLHEPRCLEAVRELAPDLAVVDGTNILKESLFGIPRLGSLNLHCGRAPDYRGAPPVFWELYNGEREVGVTIHQVTAVLDAGAVFAQEVFPIDPAPPGDPVAYARRVLAEVLRPAGLRMMADVVGAIARGDARPRPQGTTTHPTYRRPDVATQRELRRRVRARRAGAPN